MTALEVIVAMGMTIIGIGWVVLMIGLISMVWSK